jgi:hypothetical protein
MLLLLVCLLHAVHNDSDNDNDNDGNSLTRTEQMRAGTVKTSVVTLRMARMVVIKMVGSRKSRGTDSQVCLGSPTVYIGYGIMGG